MKFEFDELSDAEAREGLGNQLAEKVGRPLSTNPRLAGSTVLWLTYLIKEIHESTARGRYSDRQRDAREIIKKSKELQSLLSSFESNWGKIPSQEYVDSIFYLPDAVSRIDTIRLNFEREATAAEYGSRNMNGYSHFIGVRCADEFRRAFNEEPKIGYDRLTQQYSGPFLHFVRFIFDRVELEYADASIFKALKRKEKDKVSKIA